MDGSFELKGLEDFALFHICDGGKGEVAVGGREVHARSSEMSTHSQVTVSCLSVMRWHFL